MNAVYFFWQLRILTDDLMDGYLTFDEWESKKAEIHSQVKNLNLWAQLDALHQQMDREGICSIPTK